MICDAETLDLAQGIEGIIGALPDDLTGYVKPELMQSVLEVATLPCADVAEANTQLADLRRLVREVAADQGLTIGASGTHPAARYEDQLIVDLPRYKELADELGWIAERELIFGTHVHIGIDDAEKAVDSLLTAIADALKRGDEVRLTGFGTFTVATRAAGQARNPRTGEPVTVAASRQPKFKAGKALKDALN